MLLISKTVSDLDKIADVKEKSQDDSQVLSWHRVPDRSLCRNVVLGNIIKARPFKHLNILL